MRLLLAKRVAIFIIICILSFSAVLAVNAEAREKVSYWIIEVFEKFSIFTSRNIDESNSLDELVSTEINYIPARFELSHINEGRNMI